MVEALIYLALGLLVGILIGYLFGQRKLNSNAPTNDLLRLEKDLDELRSLKEQAVVERATAEGRLEKSIEVFNQQKEALDKREVEIREQTVRAERLEVEKQKLEQRLNEQVAELDKLNERFRVEFKNLAEQILKQNSKEFAESNQLQIGNILNPLKEKIEKFEKRVNDVYNDESKNRSELMGQVKALMDLNKRISEEASNLTNALKGDTKKQGTWGELILERILESSGLEKGIEYETQVSSRTEDGMFRPDVVVRLPENKVVIIDSKVSLTAYEAYINSEDATNKSRFLDQHVLSIRTHIKSLSGKDYPSKSKGESLEFTLMFVPIEAGFSEALKHDNDLFTYAWDSRIIIVSPTTLLVTLRTIASVWKQEKQNKNVQEIARLAGAMYDKFHGFVEDIAGIETQLDRAKTSVSNARNKLSTGKGNLMTTSQKIKALGAKTSKDLTSGTLESSEED